MYINVDLKLNNWSIDMSFILWFNLCSWLSSMIFFCMVLNTIAFTLWFYYLTVPIRENGEKYWEIGKRPQKSSC